jgi:phenylalanyl-tRNA synthetase beta chain
MPVVTLQRSDLCRIIGRDFELEHLATRMPMLGGDLEHAKDDAITIEWFPDRPDLLSAEGTGRALRAFLDVAPGLALYPVRKGKEELHVDAAVQGVRPYAALCFVRGVRIDEAALKALVDAQEKLCLAPGRKRRKIAIGLHDARDLRGPFRYTVAGPVHAFVPLGETRTMTPVQILAEHPKGKEYGHLVPVGVPVFLDGGGQVISLPPIINAARTAVTTSTTDILVDVTGTDADSVARTVALLASGLAERGGTIESVQVHDARGTWSCPDLRPRERVLHLDAVRRWLGLELEADEVATCLGRMGYDAEPFDTNVLVQVPAWRFDILHDVDLIEDVAIGYGFERFAGELPKHVSIGGRLPVQALEERCRSLLVGHGFHEARTLTLSSAAMQWTHWGAPVEPAVSVHNPALEEQHLLRRHLAPSLLDVLAHNRHRSLPQRLFEAGYVVVPGKGDAWHNEMRLAAVETGARIGLTDVQALAEAMLRDLGWSDARIVAAPEPGFITGRHAVLERAGKRIGHFGELHPDTLVAFGLAAATTVLELRLEA